MTKTSVSLSNDIRQMLLSGNNGAHPPITERLPFSYHWIPGHIRLWLAKCLYGASAVTRPQTVASTDPVPYLDDTADQLAFKFMLDQGVRPKWSWPNGARCALVLSHDVDSPGQYRGIMRLHNLAKSFGLHSTFSFVGRDLASYGTLPQQFLQEGFEIALHDITHDNTIAFLPDEQIRRRLEPLIDEINRLKIRGFRSPSWYTSISLWRMLKKIGFLYDMSALDTWPRLETARFHGTRTALPFSVDGLVVLPNTIPFELPWYLGYSVEDTFNFWKPKIDWLASQGALIMFNAHPDAWFCGNRKAEEVLRTSIDYILERYQPATMTAGQVADYFVQTQINEGMLTLPGQPMVVKTVVMRSDKNLKPPLNPMTMPRPDYLSCLRDM